MRFVILGGSACRHTASSPTPWPTGPAGTSVGPPGGRARVALGPPLELVASEMRRRVAGLLGAPVTVATRTDLASALDGADVVVNAVRIGGLDARAFDETYPQRTACPGEETMGSGRLANALAHGAGARSTWATVTDVGPTPSTST